MDCSPPGSSVNGMSQVRILEWVAISFSMGSSWPRDRTGVSCLAEEFFTTEPPRKPIHIHIPPLWCFLPFWVTTGHWVEFPELYSRFSLFVYFIHSISSVYVSITNSQYLPRPPFPLLSIHLFSISLSALQIRSSILLPLYKDSCDYIGPNWLIHDNLHISNSAN